MVDRAQIQVFCNEIAKRFRPQKIILFGSYAYGEPTENSDVDLFVIMSRTRSSGERMSLKIRREVPVAFPLDLLVRTPGVVSKRLAWGDSFTQEIVTLGQVLYEAPNA
jgi:predicted nucleotidyltransferase